MEQKFHDKAATQDVISLVGELEHSYRHAIRSAHSSKASDKVHYAVVATNLRTLRREIMKKYFGGKIGELDWCLCKSTACIRQLMYELFSDDQELFDRVEDLVDKVWSKATNEDLSGCQACKNDIDQTKDK